MGMIDKTQTFFIGVSSSFLGLFQSLIGVIDFSKYLFYIGLFTSCFCHVCGNASEMRSDKFVLLLSVNGPNGKHFFICLAPIDCQPLL